MPPVTLHVNNVAKTLGINLMWKPTKEHDSDIL